MLLQVVKASKFQTFGNFAYLVPEPGLFAYGETYTVSTDAAAFTGMPATTATTTFEARLRLAH